MGRLKSAVLYFLLVGASALCVAALLVLGRDLQAPQAVWGTWRIESDASDGLLRECRDLPLAANDAAFSISQSGRHLEIRFNDPKQTELSGFLDGPFLTVESRSSPRRAASLRLEGTVERRADADRFQGTLRVEGCEPKPVTARRERPAHREARQGH